MLVLPGITVSLTSPWSPQIHSLISLSSPLVSSYHLSLGMRAGRMEGDCSALLVLNAAPQLAMLTTTHSRPTKP